MRARRDCHHSLRFIPKNETHENLGKILEETGKVIFWQCFVSKYLFIFTIIDGKILNKAIIKLSGFNILTIKYCTPLRGAHKVFSFESHLE